MGQLNVPLDVNGMSSWQDLVGRTTFHYPEYEIPILEAQINGAHYDYSVQMETEYAKLTTQFTAIYNGKATPTEAMAKITEGINTILNK
jgi:hypothetical protein